MAKIYRRDRAGRWFYTHVGSTIEHSTMFVPSAVVRCSDKFRCSKVFWNGSRVEPALGTKCGLFGGRPYSRRDLSQHSKRDTSGDAAAAAVIFGILGLAIGAALNEK